MSAPGTAVYHQISLVGLHQDSQYVLTIWDKAEMQRAIDEKTTDRLSRLFFETVGGKNNYQPSFILFPCPNELYASFVKVNERTIVDRSVSQTYTLAPDQDAVRLIFERNAFNAVQDFATVSRQTRELPSPVGPPFR